MPGPYYFTDDKGTFTVNSEEDAAKERAFGTPEATPEEAKAYDTRKQIEANESGAGGAARAAIYSGLSTATGGLSDVALHAADPLYRAHTDTGGATPAELVAEAERQHPIASLVGTTAAFIPGLAAKAVTLPLKAIGLGAARDAITKAVPVAIGVPGLISGAGGIAEKAVAGALPAAASGLGAQIAQNVLPLGARLATELPAYAATNVVHEQALGDPRSVGEALVAEVAPTALFTLGLTAAGGLGKTALQLAGPAAGRAVPSLMSMLSGMPKEDAEYVWANRARIADGEPVKDVIAERYAEVPEPVAPPEPPGFQAASPPVKPEKEVVPKPDIPAPEKPAKAAKFVPAMRASLDATDAANQVAVNKLWEEYRPGEVALTTTADPLAAQEKSMGILSEMDRTAESMKGKPWISSMYPATIQAIRDELAVAIKDAAPADQFNAILEARRKLDATKGQWGKMIAPEQREAVSLTRDLLRTMRRSLTDAETWGETGARQAAVNSAFSDYASSRKRFLRAFFTKVPGTVSDYVADPAKIKNAFLRMGKPEGDLAWEALSDHMRDTDALHEQIERSAEGAGLEFDRASLRPIIAGVAESRVAGAARAEQVAKMEAWKEAKSAAIDAYRERMEAAAARDSKAMADFDKTWDEFKEGEGIRKAMAKDEKEAYREALKDQNAAYKEEVAEREAKIKESADRLAGKGASGMADLMMKGASLARPFSIGPLYLLYRAAKAGLAPIQALKAYATMEDLGVKAVEKFVPSSLGESSVLAKTAALIQRERDQQAIGSASGRPAPVASSVMQMPSTVASAQTGDDQGLTAGPVSASALSHPDSGVALGLLHDKMEAQQARIETLASTLVRAGARSDATGHDMIVPGIARVLAKSSGDLRKDYKNDIARVHELAGDAPTMQRMLTRSLSDVTEHAPSVAQAAGETLTNAVAYLETQIPRGPDRSPLDPEWEPSDSEIRTYMRTRAVADNPNLVPKACAAGTCVPADINAMDAIYPAYAQALRGAVAAKMAQHGAPSDPRARMGVAMLLDVGLPGMDPAAFAANQASINSAGTNAPPEQHDSPAGAPKPPKVATSRVPGRGAQSPSQRAMVADTRAVQNLSRA